MVRSLPSNVTELLLKRAGDGIRTHDNNVGNVVLCQLSYTREGFCRRLGCEWKFRTENRPETRIIECEIMVARAVGSASALGCPGTIASL